MDCKSAAMMGRNIVEFVKMFNAFMESIVEFHI